MTKAGFRKTEDENRRIERDAEGQLAKTKAEKGNDGVVGAEPRVVTGTTDATFDTDPEEETAEHRRAGRTNAGADRNGDKR